MDPQPTPTQVPKKSHKTLSGVGLFVLIAGAFFIGSYVGQRSAYDVYAVAPKVDGELVTDDQFAPFWKVWRILSEKYVAATSTEADKEARVWGAIQGLAASQGDPYTVFFPPEENTIFKSDIAGNFEGVGMEIGVRDGILTVVAPLKGSPAEKAGVTTGDRIVEIEGTPASDLSVDQAVKLIRGPKGTVVTITFFTEGDDEPVVRKITRDVINLPTIETELRKDGVFVIRLYSFSERSAQLFRGALREFVSSGSNKLIFDLRGNPGGYLEAAWDIASWFVPAGKTVVTEDFGTAEKPRVYRSKGYTGIAGKNLKMVVLVNGGSASASEIVAGALQEHGIAKLVGEKTFGKGSVQELIEITPETSLKVTIARWLTPKGHNLSEGGLVPDVEVKNTKEDAEAKRDPQLEKAAELLLK
jgi:carboxyl-terminal processing protease